MPASPWECWSPIHGISKWPPLLGLVHCTVQYLMRAAISKLKYHPNWHICLQICYQQGLVAPLTLSLAVIRIFWKTTLNIPELWIWQHSPPSIKSSNLLKVRWRQSEAVRRRDKLEILTPPPVTPLAGAVLFLWDKFRLCISVNSLSLSKVSGYIKSVVLFDHNMAWGRMEHRDRSAAGTCHYGCHLSSLSWDRVNLVSIVCHKLWRKLNIKNQFPSLPPNGKKHFEQRKDSWAGWHLMLYTSAIY